MFKVDCNGKCLENQSITIRNVNVIVICMKLYSDMKIQCCTNDQCARVY